MTVLKRIITLPDRKLGKRSIKEAMILEVERGYKPSFYMGQEASGLDMLSEAVILSDVLVSIIHVDFEGFVYTLVGDFELLNKLTKGQIVDVNIIRGKFTNKTYITGLAHSSWGAFFFV